MGTTSVNHDGLRTFGPFTFDPECGELARNGYRIRLQPQPALILAILTDQPGKLVSREEIYRAVWGEDTHVDFEHRSTTASARFVLHCGTTRTIPEYLETVPKRGYRFLVPVDVLNGIGSRPARSSDPAPQNGASAEIPNVAVVFDGGHRNRFEVCASASRRTRGIGCVWGFVAEPSSPSLPLHASDTVLIADFENQTGDPRFDDALLTAFTVSIGQSRFANFFRGAGWNRC